MYYILNVFVSFFTDFHRIVVEFHDRNQLVSKLFVQNFAETQEFQ
jgi:hypothetical protein